MATCKNGHYYPDDKAECPYCPRPTGTSTDQDAPALKTQIGTPFGKPDIQPDHTRVTPPIVPQNPPYTQVGASATPPKDAGSSPEALRTQIGGVFVPSSINDQKENGEDRRLMGWLVSFDQNPMGKDYQLREGRNAIGTAPDGEIVLSNDPGISGKHMTILFRLGEVLFKDELSTNGTWINGKLMNEGQLQDGDEIKLGNTHFLFRSAHSAQTSTAKTGTL